MTSTGTAPTCTCQTPMTAAKTAGIFYCPNCDVCQPQEREMVGDKPLPRVTTRADRRFHLAWEQRKRSVYGTN